MTKKIFTLVALLCLLATGASAQGIFGKIKDKAKEKVRQKVEKAIDGDEANEQESEEPAEEAAGDETPATTAAKPKAAESTYAKSDFVPGDIIFFEDYLEGEQLGEFPSQWDLMNGTAEVARHDGKMAIFFENDDARIAPLIKGSTTGYLPDQFTLEFDYWCNGEEDFNASYHVFLKNANNDECANICIATENDLNWSIAKPGLGDWLTSTYSDIGRVENKNAWNHFALSFNKRALKLYINGTRVANLPNVERPFSIELGGEFWDDHRYFITGIRLAQGAVPLYDRVMSEGKIVTYAITFDTGKATIKPESMTEIARIKKLMDENTTLKFEVQGHCDNTGSAATNDKLSQQRADAIKAKLQQMGIAQDRLTAVGKGSREPIADNSTADGRAKNRRVEFVKK